jgi:Tfp pilus assembly PilM family ATPase
LLRFIQFQPVPLLGLEIQADEIRLVQLRRSKKTILLEQAMIMRLPVSPVFDEGNIPQGKEISACLQALVQRMKIKKCEVAVSLPVQAILSKRIQLPAMLSELECEEEIAANIKDYFPSVTNDLCYDYVVLGSHDEMQNNVLLVAAYREQLNSYVSLIECVGLKVKFVEVDIYALVRAVRFAISAMNAQQTWAVLSINSSVIQFMVVHHNEIIFYQKFIYNDLEGIYVQLKDALERYYVAWPQLFVSNIFLAGQAEKSNELAFLIKKRLLIDTKYINPFVTMSFSNGIKQPVDTLEKLLVSCGLALKRLDI